MPQMKPTFWLMMLLLTYIYLIVLTTLIYFMPSFSNFNMLNHPQISMKNPPLWTWKW